MINCYKFCKAKIVRIYDFFITKCLQITLVSNSDINNFEPCNVYMYVRNVYVVNRVDRNYSYNKFFV